MLFRMQNLQLMFSTSHTSSHPSIWIVSGVTPTSEFSGAIARPQTPYCRIYMRQSKNWSNDEEAKYWVSDLRIRFPPSMILWTSKWSTKLLRRASYRHRHPASASLTRHDFQSPTFTFLPRVNKPWYIALRCASSRCPSPWRPTKVQPDTFDSSDISCHDGDNNLRSASCPLSKACPRP